MDERRRWKRGWPLWRIGLLGCALIHFDAPTVVEARATTMISPFILPVPSACVSSPFGARHLPHGPLPNAFHNGIDLPAAVGTPVLAVGPGKVVRVQRKGPGGLEVLIQHNGFIGIYSHLGLVAPAIAEGYRTISGGEKIGTVGRSGLTFGPHLFFAMIVGDQAVDPAPILALQPCGQQAVGDAQGRRQPTRVY